MTGFFWKKHGSLTAQRGPQPIQPLHFAEPASADLARADMDDRNLVAVRREQLVIGRDVDGLQIEIEFGRHLGEQRAHLVAEVASMFAEQRDPGGQG